MAQLFSQTEIRARILRYDDVSQASSGSSNRSIHVHEMLDKCLIVLDNLAQTDKDQIVIQVLFGVMRYATLSLIVDIVV